MANRLFYLLSYLPSLPGLSGTPPIEFSRALQLVKSEGDSGLAVVAEAFELENKLLEIFPPIGKVSDNFDAVASGSAGIEFPEIFKPCFSRKPSALQESDWLSSVWTAFFMFLDQVGSAVGSSLLQDWACHEYSFRYEMALRRNAAMGTSGHSGMEMPDKQLLSSFRDRAGDWNHSSLITTGLSLRNPMETEKFFDEARISFIEERSERYSFSLDELVGYLLTLRLIVRHSKFDAAKGEKILQEVTAS